MMLRKLANESLNCFKIKSTNFPIIQYLDEFPKDTKIIKKLLKENGFCLIRNTNIKSPNDIQEYNLANKIYEGDVMDYTQGVDTRVSVTDEYSLFKVSEAHPPNVFLPFHNELVYTSRFPKYCSFVCERPSQIGGNTPISNTFKVYEGLKSKSPDIIKKLHDEGINYIRNLPDESNLHKYNVEGNYPQRSWQETFDCETKEEIEKLMNSINYKYEWIKPDENNNNCDKDIEYDLRITYNDSAFIKCNETNRYSFANSLIGMYGSYFDYFDFWKNEKIFSKRPFHALWGDNTEFDYNDHILNIWNEYYENTVVFDWKPSDIIIVDNVWWSHARFPYQGKRQLYLLMGVPLNRIDKFNVQYENQINPLTQIN